MFGGREDEAKNSCPLSLCTQFQQIRDLVNILFLHPMDPQI